MATSSTRSGARRPAKRGGKGATVTTTVKGGDKNALGSILGGIAKGVLDSNALYGLAQAGAAFGEAKAAARLQARAAVFAALATKPYKNGEKPRAELVAEATAVVAELEAAPGSVAMAKPLARKQAIDLITDYSLACDQKDEAEVERGDKPNAYDDALARRQKAYNALLDALMGKTTAAKSGFGFLGTP